MATVDKNFRIKNGLVVEGTTGTINGNNILTESAGDSYILNLVGGATLVKSVDIAVFNVDGSGKLTVKANVFDSYGAASSAQSAAESYADSAISSAINLEVSNRNNAIATAKSEAISTSESYADTVSTNAKNDAKTYADGLISTEVTNRNNAIDTAKSQAISTSESYTDSAISSEVSRANNAYDANGAASTAYTNAVNDANTYTDGQISSLNTTAQGYATTAENNAKSYADGLASTADTNAQGYATTAENNAKSYADTVAGTAETNAKSYADTKVANLVGMAPALLDTLEKIDNAIANDANFSTTLLNDIASAQATAESYTDSAISTEVTNRNSAIATAKSEAVTASESYTDTAISTEVTNRNSAITTAENAAKSYADNLVANGNLSATPTYQAINITNYTEQVGKWTAASTAGSQVTAFSYSTSWGSAEFLVRVMSNAAGHLHSQLSKLLVTTDGAGNVAITEYGIVTTNGSMGDVTADINGGNVRILVTPTYASSEVIVSGTLLAYND